MARLKTVIHSNSDGQLAKELGLSASAYANLKARSSIPYEKAINLAISYDVNLHWLFTGTGICHGVQPATVPQSFANPRIQPIAETLSALNDQQISQIEYRLVEFQTLNQLVTEVAKLKAKLDYPMTDGQMPINSEFDADRGD